MSEITIDGLEPTEKVARLQDRIDVLEEALETEMELVAQLKSEADWWAGNRTRSDDKAGVAVGSILFREAASELTRMAREIERLREALQLIIANPAFRAESIARAALEAKP